MYESVFKHPKEVLLLARKIPNKIEKSYHEQ